MFAKIKQLAAAGAAVAGVGWITVVSPGVAHAQPPRIPQGTNFTCPDVAGITYVQDPANSNAYYMCIDGLQQQHLRGTRLVVQSLCGLGLVGRGPL